MPRLILPPEFHYDPKSELQKVNAALYQKSYYDYFIDAWKQVMPGLPLKEEFYIYEICRHAQAVIEGRIRNLIVTIPPRHAKSWILSAFLPTWCWLVKPTTQIISASYKQNLAVRDCVRSRRLMNTEWYQSILKHTEAEQWQFTSDQNEKTRYDNTLGGHRLSTSVGGSITGDGGSLFLIDDALSTKGAESDAELVNLADWWFESVPMRLNDPTTDSFIIIQQRLHQNDLVGLIQESEGFDDWDVINLPMRYEEYDPDDPFMIPNKSSLGFVDPRTEEGQLLSPQRYPEREVQKLEMKLGKYGSASQLQQRPSPRGGGIIEENWWIPISKEEFFNEWQTHGIYQSWDTAYSEEDRKNNNHSKSACTTWGLCSRKDGHGLKYAVLMDVFAKKLGFPDLRVEAIELYDKFKPDLVIIEAKASGKSLIQEFNRSGIYCYEYNPTGKGDKDLRLSVTSPNFQQGMVRFLDWRPCCQDAIRACGVYPKGDGKDIVDTTSQMIQYLRDNYLLLAGDVDFDSFERGLVTGSVVEDADDEPIYG